MKPLNPTELSKLSKEQMLSYYDALKEYKKRKKLQRPGYIPNAMQAATHACNKDIIINLSGNGSGKTAGLVHEAWWGAEGYQPILKRYYKLPSKVTVVLDHPDKVDDKWIPEFRKWFGITDDMCSKGGKPYVTSIKPPGISEISFMFHQQDPLTFESIEGELYIFDEPPPRWLFFALIRGAREKRIKIRVIIAGTPLSEPWLRREFLVPWSRGELPDVECFRFDSDVNKDNLEWDGQLKYFAMLSENERATRRHGQFFDTEGQALAGIFDRAIHLVKREDLKWQDNWPCVLAIDPHPSKKHHAVLLGANPNDDLFILKETAQKMLPREFARHMAGMVEGFRIIEVVVDSLASSQMTGGEGFASFIEVVNDEWKKMGSRLRCRATTFDDKSDEDFVTRIQAALAVPVEADNFGRKTPKLRICEDCKGFIYDVENVGWQRDKKNDSNKPKLEISGTDFLSCAKYGLATGLFYKKGELQALQRPIPASYGGKVVKKSPQTREQWLKD